MSEYIKRGFCSFTKHKENEKICQCGFVIPNTENDIEAVFKTRETTQENPPCFALLNLTKI